MDSAWGTTHPGGEYFGVKGQSPDGKSVALATYEESRGRLHGETDSFRSYGSLSESADDYGRFLVTNKRYSAAFDHKDDGHRFIHEAAEAGYATDSHYESKVRSIIDHHNLTQYDSAQSQNQTVGQRPPSVAAPPRGGADGGDGAAPATARSSSTKSRLTPQEHAKILWGNVAAKGRKAMRAQAASQAAQQGPRLPRPTPRHKRRRPSDSDGDIRTLGRTT